MLKGIHPALSPELLKTLAEMGHGDEIVLADAHFPAHSLHKNVIRADGISIDILLEAITPLFEFDAYVDAPLLMMKAVEGDSLDPNVETRYLNAIESAVGFTPNLTCLERFDFYTRANRLMLLLSVVRSQNMATLSLKKGLLPFYKQ
ncbi:L-fucose mutarotase [Haemophilus influenzae]|uniref:L-fucose mutarotase n=1 Tax=Haemophilus influenzae TaxID=727 RepID=UPI001E28C928|nr:L-fucose mutarotase [Haemophilus influenzae]